jgi:hypothetical protein
MSATVSAGTPGISEAASEKPKAKRGRPRAWYSTVQVESGRCEVPTGNARTRRGQQNDQLVMHAWWTLLHHWRSEWAWFWYRTPGEIDPSCKGPTTRTPYPNPVSGAPKVRFGVLVELGRLDESTRLEWAAELCKLPLDTSTRRIARGIRDARLGHAASGDVSGLRAAAAKALDRYITEHPGVELDAGDAHLAITQLADRIATIVEPPETDEPRTRIEVPRVRVSTDDSSEDALPLPESEGVLLRARVSA